MSHFVLMTIYAALVAVFFAVLYRRDFRGQTKLFLQIFLGMVGIAVAIAWVMFPFPSGPPTPFP